MFWNQDHRERPGRTRDQESAFLRNPWIDEVVINDIEVCPSGLDSLEFDDEGGEDQLYANQARDFRTARSGNHVGQSGRDLQRQGLRVVSARRKAMPVLPQYDNRNIRLNILRSRHTK